MSYIITVSGERYPILRKIKDTSRKEKDAQCKVCGSRGVKVLKVTVVNHVKSEFWELLMDSYSFCSTSNCPIVYFNTEINQYISINKVRTEIFHKSRSKKRPVCYCMGVTEDMIMKALLIDKCRKSLRDLVEYTKAGTGKWCLVTNPTGRCCIEYLRLLIQPFLTTKRIRKQETPYTKYGDKVEVTLKVKGMHCEGCAIAIKNGS